jgi:phosphoglycerate dehydrogenase-like enzyme
MLQPYFDDFKEVAADKFDISLFDPERPIASQFQGIEVVVEHGGAFSTPEMLDAGVASRVKLWQVTATGLDHVNVENFLERGITLANMPGPVSTAIPMAEHALFMMLALSKRLYSSQHSFNEGILNLPMTSEIFGKTVGLIGLGASGKELARRCRALGMIVMAIDLVDVSKEILDELGIEFFGKIDDLDKVLGESDYISLHIPLTKRTRQFIDRRSIDLMKKSACLINVSRGELLDEEALIEAIRQGHIAGAGLDALCDEPVEPTHPLLHHENVIVTPHNGVVTRELSLRRAQVATDQVRRVVNGESPLYQVRSLPQ